VNGEIEKKKIFLFFTMASNELQIIWSNASPNRYPFFSFAVSLFTFIFQLGNRLY